MTVFTNTWDNASPADTDQAKLYASKLRDFKVDVQERLAVDHKMDLDAEDGTHIRVSLDPQGSDPTAEAADHGQLYAKVTAAADTTNITELYYDDSVSAPYQLTYNGSLHNGHLNGAGLPTAVDGEYVGQRYYDTTNFGWHTCTAAGSPGTWVPDIPAKTIAMFSGDPTTDIPDGWLLCDGSSSTPDLSGRFIVGYDAGDAEYDGVDPIGSPQTGGEKEHTLTVDEMPAHTHELEVERFHATGTNKVAGNNHGGTSANVTTQIQSTGGGDPHENRPPYYVLAYIIKMPVT